MSTMRHNNDELWARHLRWRRRKRYIIWGSGDEGKLVKVHTGTRRSLRAEGEHQRHGRVNKSIAVKYCVKCYVSFVTCLLNPRAVKLAYVRHVAIAHHLNTVSAVLDNRLQFVIELNYPWNDLDTNASTKQDRQMDITVALGVPSLAVAGLSCIKPSTYFLCPSFSTETADGAAYQKGF